MSIKILKHPCKSGGPFNQGDTIEFELPRYQNIVKSRLQYKLQVTSKLSADLGTPIMFGDNIKSSTQDILFSNAYFNNADGLVDQSPNHRIRKCNDWEYEENWLQKNCDSTWGYEKYYDENDNMDTVLTCGTSAVPAVPKLLMHPVERFFDRCRLPYDTMKTTIMKFEVDPDISSTKFISVIQYNGLTSRTDACDNVSPAGGAKTLTALTITNAAGPTQIPDLAAAKVAYPNGGKVLVTYTDDATVKQLIVTLSADTAAGAGTKFTITFPATVFTSADAAACTAISVQPYTPNQYIALDNIDLDGASKIDATNGGKKAITLTKLCADQFSIPTKPGAVYMLRSTGYKAGVPAVIDTPVQVTVVANVFVDNATKVIVQIFEDPDFTAGADANSTLIGCMLYRNPNDVLPLSNVTYQITEPNIVLHVAQAKPKIEGPLVYYFPKVRTLNFNGSSRMSLDVDLEPNCKLVCMYFPTFTNTLSILDNATRYRLQLDGIDTTLRDITFLTPAYHYINLYSNYGAVKPLGRLKVDPKLALNTAGNQTQSLAFISQLVFGNKNMHFDVYADGANAMSTKILYIYQYCETPANSVTLY